MMSAQHSVFHREAVHIRGRLRPARTAFALGCALTMLAAAPALAQSKAEASKQDRACAAYGPGFQKAPGSDSCIRVGGAVRFDGYTGGAIGSAPAQGTSSGPTSTATDTADPWKTAR